MAKFANMRSTKALGDYFALAESPPTPATLQVLKRSQVLPVRKADQNGATVPLPLIASDELFRLGD